MRFSPALVLFTLAASTASLAAPVALPGRHIDGVTPRVVQIGLAPADLVGSPVGDLLSTVRSGANFSMLGLTWSVPVRGPVGTGDLPLEVRTHTRGRWTQWQQLERDDDGPDAGAEDNAGQAATAPLWVGPSDAFQLRVDRPTGIDVALPTRLNLALIDPGSSPHDYAFAPVEPAVVNHSVTADMLPPIGSRQTWGANEHLRHGDPRYTDDIRVAFVHHTAGGNHYSPSDVPKIIRGVYAFHTRVRGWSDVGYNFLVDRFGRIWEGRAGGIERAVLGAHTGGFNSHSFGVAVLGNFVHARPTPATLHAIERVIAWKFSHYGDSPGLNPDSDTTLVSAGGGTDRWRRGRTVNFIRISGHRDAGATECPGRYLYAKLDEIRQRVAELQDNGGTEVGATPSQRLGGGAVQTGRTLLQQIVQPPKQADPSARGAWGREQAVRSAGR
jgi:N-acetylmuramoyl-L-alanine amidase